MSDSWRPSIPGRISAVANRLGWAALVWAIPPILSALASYAAVQARSIVTEQRLKGALSICVTEKGELPNIVCRLEDVIVVQAQTAVVLSEMQKRMDVNDEEKFALRVRLRNEVSARVGVQVALHRAMTYVLKVDQREAVYDAQYAATLKFDELSLRPPDPNDKDADVVTRAANGVLREARVIR